MRAAFPGAEAVGELVAAGYASVLDTVAALVWCALLRVGVRGEVCASLVDIAPPLNSVLPALW